MLVDINTITINKKEEEIEIEGLNVDDLMMSDLDSDESKFEVTFTFDLKNTGHRTYLYKICKSKRKPEHKTMQETIDSLVGQTININFNFLTRTAK